MNKHLARFLIVLIVLCAFFTLFACQSKTPINYCVKLVEFDGYNEKIVQEKFEYKVENGQDFGTSRFDHWNTKKDDSGDIITNKDVIKVDKDITLYAIYDNRYRINFNNATKDKFVEIGDSFEFPSISTKNYYGRKLLGWSDKQNGEVDDESEVNGHLYKPGEKFTPESNMKFYTVLTPIIYTINYKYKDEIYSQKVPFNNNGFISYDCDFTNLSEDLSKYNTFICWNDKEDGSGKDYYVWCDYINEDLTLYPKFRRKTAELYIYDENSNFLCKSDLLMNIPTEIKMDDTCLIPYTNFKFYDFEGNEIPNIINLTSDKSIKVKYTVENCTDNIYNLKIDGTYELVRAKTNSINCKIDEMYNNKLVTSVADYAFYKSNIVNLELPQTIENIKEKAFNDTCIKNVKCYSTDVEINDYVGLNNLNHSTIYVNNNVYEKFTEIDSNLNLINDNLCNDCVYENGLILSSDKTKLVGVYDRNELINLNIPTSVNTICRNAFSNIELPNLTLDIPETVNCIEKGTFYDSQFKKVILPDNLKVLNEKLFENANIKEIVLPESLEVIKSYALSLNKLCKIYVKNTTVDLNDRINLYNLPLSLKKIETYGIEGLNISITNLKGIDLEKNAILDCKFINNFNIEDNDSEIADYAFEICEFQNIIINTSLDLSIFKNCKAKYIINKSNGKLKYYSYAFSRCNLYIGKNEEIENFYNFDVGDIYNIILPNTLNKIENDSIIYLSQNDIDIMINHIENPNDFNESNFDFGDYHYNQGILYDKEFTKVLACLSESENVVLPETVIEIEDGAFYDNQKLKNINLENIQIIGKKAFYNCKNLNEINLTSLETWVEDNLFLYAQMNKIILPKNLTELNNKFINFKFKEIVFNENLIKIESNTFKYSNWHIVYLDNFEYPLNCEVEENTFKNIYVNELVINEEVTVFHSNLYPHANSYVFHENIKDIYFENRIENKKLKFYSTTVPTLHFSKSFLQSNLYIIPNEKTSDYKKEFEKFETKYNKLSFVEFDKDTKDSDFEYNDDKTEIIKYVGNSDLVEIPSTIKKINSKAFRNANIQKIILNEGLQSIGEYAFEYCKYLNSINIPNSVTEIGERCFADCFLLKDVNLSNNLKTLPYGMFIDCHALEKIVIPNSVISVGDRCFDDCRNLKNVKLSESLQSLPNHMFCYCNALENIVIPNSVISIGDNCFRDCMNLKNVKLSENLESLSSCMFYYCNALENIVIPNSVISVGDNCFRDCMNLKNVKLSENLESLSSYMFGGCRKIKSIQIPNSCKNIFNGAFNQTSIKTLFISKNIETIYNLYNGIEEVVLDEDNKNFVMDEKGCLYNADKTRLIYIPNSMKSFVVPDSVVKLDEGLENKNLKYFKLNNKCTFGIGNVDYLISNNVTKKYSYDCFKNIFFDFALTEDFEFYFDKSNVYCLNEFKEEMKGLSYFEKIIFIDEIPSEDVLCKYWNESKNYISKIDGSEACKIDTNNIKTILEIASNCEILKDTYKTEFDLSNYYKIILSADNIVEMPFELKLNNYCQIYVPEDKYEDYINDNYWYKYKFKINKIS